MNADRKILRSVSGRRTHAGFDQKDVVGVSAKKLGCFADGHFLIFRSCSAGGDLERYGDITSRVDVPVSQRWADARNSILGGFALLRRRTARIEDSFPGKERTFPLAVALQFSGETDHVAGAFGGMF